MKKRRIVSVSTLWVLVLANVAISATGCMFGLISGNTFLASVWFVGWFAVAAGIASEVER